MMISNEFFKEVTENINFNHTRNKVNLEEFLNVQ